jgi:hypothetical protein
MVAPAKDDEKKIPRDIQALVPNEDERAILRGLKREKEGYEARVELVKKGRSKEDLDELGARIKYVDAEIKRIEKDGVTDRKAAAQVLVEREEERIESEREDKSRTGVRS